MILTPQALPIGYYASLAQIAACGQPSEETEITPALNESAVTPSAKSPEFVELPDAIDHFSIPQLSHGRKARSRPPCSGAA